MTTAAPSAPPAPSHWDRSRLVPTRRQLALVVALAALAALALMPITINPYVELLGETLFVGIVLLFGFTVAGAWRQTLLPRWVAQVLAIALGAALSPLIVQLLSVGGDFSAFIGSRHHVRGYMLVVTSAAIIGTLFALGALYRERDAQARAERCVLRSSVKRWSAKPRTRGCI